MLATTVLPDRDEISRRIAVADPLRDGEVLYPGILDRMAGRTLTGSGVAVALINVVVEHMEGRDYGEATGISTVLLIGLLPDFINALVDDEQIRAKALATLEQAHQH